jgi:hypothetical protein
LEKVDDVDVQDPWEEDEDWEVDDKYVTIPQDPRLV